MGDDMGWIWAWLKGVPDPWEYKLPKKRRNLEHISKKIASYIGIVQQQASVSRKEAIEALRETDCDLVEAIMKLTK